MARFCTKCGTAADADSKFCAECGAPYAVAAQGAGVPTPAAPVPARPAGKRVALVGGIVAVLVMAGAGVAYMLSDEAATPEVFAGAITRYYAANPDAASQLLCVGGLRLNTDTVRLNGFDAEQRMLMDDLAVAGLFLPAEVQSSGGFFAVQTYSYRRTEAGGRAIRNGKLCVAPAVKVKDVRFQAESAATQVLARFHYDLERPEAWLSGRLAQQVRRRLSLDDERIAVMQLRDGKWSMSSDNPRVARAIATGASMAAPPSLLQRVKGWLRVGNPLIGKWRVSNALWLAGTVVTFGDTHAAVGRPDEAVSYDIKDNRVTVHYTERGTSDVFIIVDDNHISVESGGEPVQLERMRE